MTTSAIIEARILDLEADSVSETTLRDILSDMLELEPAAYANAATDLCFRLLEFTNTDSSEDTPKTMKDFLEASND
jgi:hypothetical protein